MKLLLHWFIGVVAILIAAYIVPGSSITFVAACIAAVVIGVLNLFIKPILLVLTLPINLITLGLFTLVINALLVMLAAVIVPGFGIAGFWTAFLFALVLAVVNWVFNSWGKD
ncbi:MAG: rane protein of unknown function [Parcubacteria group bacterium]|nr:rane protein of unknown function [Parcubacteria group bacterium]